MSVTNKISLKHIKEVKGLLSLCRILSNVSNYRLVGGCIRDIFLGREVKDIDIATDIQPQDMIKILEAEKIKTIPTGLDFGTITAVIEGNQFEITTLREDVRCYGRKAEVRFTDSWLADASRRDFTVNALYADLEGNVMDFFDGVEHAEKRLIKFIGEPAERIREDYLRILRYFRFYSYMGVQCVDQDSLIAVAQLAPGLQDISGERIRAEMLKLLQSEFALQALALLNEAGIEKFLGLPQLVGLRAIKFCFRDPLVNLAALLKRSQAALKDADGLCSRWRLSQAEKRYLLHLLRHQFQLAGDRQYHKQQHYLLQRELFEAHAMLEATLAGDIDSFEVAQRLIIESKYWSYPQFPIQGEDLLDMGLEGPKLGEVQKALLAAWIDSNFTKSKNELLASARMLGE